MIPYIIHATLLLSFCFFAYWLLLRQETFYKINRFFLVTSLGLSLALPLIHMPSNLSFRKPIVIEVEKPSSLTELAGPEVSINSNNTTEAITSISDTKVTIGTNEIPQNSSVNGGLFTSLSDWSIGEVLWVVYLTGILVFVITFFIQLIILLVKKRKLEYIQDGKFRIYELTEDTAPFSFLKWIFINPALYDFDTYNNIIEHEKIHVSQAHYLDKLVAEIAVIVFWFNPFAWMYRRAINNNLEFLTDDEMLGKGTERETYQMNLLKVCVPEHALTLTTNYNESFLSERIKMMNAKKSSARSSWKYLLVLPLIGFTLATLNAVEPIYKNTTVQTSEVDTEKQPSTNIVESKPKANKNKLEDKNNSAQEKAQPTPQQDTQLQENKISVSTNTNVSAIENNLNNRTELSMHDEHMDMRIIFDDGFVKMEQEINTGIKSKAKCDTKKSCDSSKNSNFSNKVKAVLGEHNNEETKPGYWRGLVDGDNACFFMNNSKSRHDTWTMNECFPIKEFNNFSLGKNVSFNLKRAPGTLYFEGSFDDQYEGIGKFRFEGDPGFSNFLIKNGYESPDDRDLMLLFLNKTDKSFIKKIKQLGYPPSLAQLKQLGIFKVDANRLAEFNRIFDLLNEEGSLQEMTEMAIHGVDEAFVKSLLQVNSDDLSVRKAIEAKIHNVDGAIIKSVKQFGFDNISLSKIIEFKIHGVSPNDLKEYKSIGFTHVTAQKLIEFSIHGVTPKFINEIQKLGYEDIQPSKLVAFKVHGVSQNYIKDLTKVGMKNLSPDNLIAGQIHGVSANYIQSLKDEGVTGITFNNSIEGQIHGVSQGFMKGGKKKGYAPKQMKEWINLAIHGF